ncbi:MAG: NCS2 family permease [Lachnospiraceae bacterium]|jgi:AGZA family xanthine/uracil permease-like MFS transporter|nr:NCS2 family permease [Lachnospiraceae bacterium]
MLEKWFQLKKHGTTVKTEIMAGITTFMTMAYILAVNPTILGATGMDAGAIFTATALAALIGTLAMAIFANYPFAMAPGMGLNAYFAYTVVLGMGYEWPVALAAVFIEGLIFLVLSLVNVREAIFDAIPKNLKVAVSVGIGLFIAFIGLQSANIVVGNQSVLVALYTNAGLEGKYGLEAGTVTLQNGGIAALISIVGIIITAILVVKKVKGSILWGILITWLIGVICELTHLYVPLPAAGLYSTIPDFSNWTLAPDISPIFAKMDFSGILSLEFVVVVFAFLFVDIFDTIGTLVGVATNAKMLDKDGKLPKIKQALLADALATTAGAVLGTSTTTTYVESASGVTDGGRTGLTAVTTAILFGLALLISPIFLAIPAFATTPALVVVGFYMFCNIKNIDVSDMAEAIPAYICVVAMPLFYSISEGIAMGIITYVVLNIIGKESRKKVSILMICLAIVFILKYIFL